MRGTRPSALQLTAFVMATLSIVSAASIDWSHGCVVLPDGSVSLSESSTGAVSANGAGVYISNKHRDSKEEAAPTVVSVQPLTGLLRGNPAEHLHHNILSEDISGNGNGNTGSVVVTLSNGRVMSCPPMHAATRKLTQAGGAPCGEFLPGLDLAGSDLPGVGASTTASNQACLDLCLSTPSCNAVARVPDTRCFLKNIPEDLPAIPVEGITSYRVCPEGSPTPSPGATPSPGGACGGGGQPVCTGAQLEARDPKWECDQGFVGGAGGVCVPYGSTGPSPPATTPSPPPAAPPAASGDAFYGVPAGPCPGGVSSKLPAGKHQNVLNVPAAARSLYTGPNALSPLNGNNQITLSYTTIAKGGTYCFQPGQKKVSVGGTVMISNGGQCSLPPTNANGGSCCTLYAWQPNEAGYYYEDCSMKINIGGDGVYYFETEIAGNEATAGWGPDPEPHIHYDLDCSACAGGNVRFWNKFYTNTVWPGDGAGAVHGAEQTTFNGMEAYKYNIILQG